MPERKSYVARLMKEALIAEAYMVWVNSLTRDQRKRLGPVSYTHLTLPTNREV